MPHNERLLEKLHLMQVQNLALEEHSSLNSMILDGLDAILNSSDTHSSLAKFFDILHQAISYSCAILIKENTSNEFDYSVVTSTAPNHNGVIDSLFRLNLLNNNVDNIFNLQSFPDWKINDKIWKDQRSFITNQIHTNIDNYRLFLFSEEVGAFNQSDLSLLKRFTTFAGNTIIQFEQKKLLVRQKELEKKQKNIEKVLLNSEKMASLGQMAAGVAHEINNPLSYIVSNIQNLAYNIRQMFLLIEALKADENIDQTRLRNILEDFDFEELNDDSNDIINEMNEGSERVKEIVQGLRQFAHPDETQISEVNITELIDNTLRVAWNQIKYSANIEKSYHNEPIIIIGRARQLSQVFLNLFMNAAQAMTEGQGLIRIETRADGDNAYISIIDNGKGIDSKFIDKIFDPFFTTKPVGKGTGLGLAISKSIIEEHSGKITLRSELGRGTIIKITLPKKPELGDVG